MRVLPLGRFRLEELAQRRAVRFVWLFPVLLNRVPAFAQPFLVGIAVLRNDCGDPVRVLQRKTETYRSSVVENIQCKTAEPNPLDEGANGFCQLLECVAVLLAIGCVRKAKSRQIGSDDVITIRQSWDQVSEHVRRRWKA